MEINYIPRNWIVTMEDGAEVYIWGLDGLEAINAACFRNPEVKVRSSRPMGDFNYRTGLFSYEEHQ